MNFRSLPSRLIRFQVLILLFTGCTFTCLRAQNPVIRESFSTEDLQRWSGDTTHFSFNRERSNILLQLNADSAGSAMISTPLSRTDGTWEIFVQADLSPSNNNYLLIWLLSDRPDLREDPSGYALRIGENGSDDRVRLLRMVNGSPAEEILQSTTSYGSGGPLRMLVERNLSGDWKLSLSSDYQVIPVAEAEGPGDPFENPAWFGFEVIYSASNIRSWQFDFEITPEPIRITGTRLEAADELRLGFNLPMAPNAEVEAIFESGSGLSSIQQINRVAADTLSLLFAEPLPSGMQELRVRNLTGANGTRIIDTLLSFPVYDAPKQGDLLISEFMNDPPTGCPEYLELYNAGSGYLKADGLQISDNRSLRSLEAPGKALPDGSFLVLTPDSAGLASCFGPGDYTPFSLPSLNNGSDQIIIRSADGLLLDSLSYTVDWGDPDFSLERRSFEVPAHFLENWQVSGSDEGGTPGRPNITDPDTVAPELLYLQFLSERSVQFFFSERVLEADEGSRITISPSVPVQALSYQNHTLTLFIEGSFTDRQSYTFLINDIGDIFGNVAEPQSAQARFLRFSEAIRDDIRINEFRNRATTGEFVELINTSEKNIDISGWQLRNSSDSRYSIPDGSYLAPGEFFVAGDPDLYGSASTGLSLKETSDQILLYDANEQLIDSLYFDDSWLPDEEQRSIEKTDAFALSADPSKWRAAEDAQHSAGAQNTVFAPDEEPPTILFARRTATDTIEIRFSEFVREAGSVYLDDRPLTHTPYRLYHSGSMILETPEQQQREREQIYIPELSDIAGNTAELRGDVIQSLKQGDLIINEILFDPISDPEDGIPDQKEFVEVRNLRDFPVGTSGIYLSHIPNEEGKITPMVPDIPAGSFIPASAYFLLYADDESAPLSESSVGHYFGLKADQNPLSAPVSRSSLGLSSDSDEIFLRHVSEGVLDSLHYKSDWHNPNLISTKGISLERISASVPASDPDNWSSSATAAGATPLLKNSIAMEIASEKAGSRIRIAPDPFSPNADGFEDHTLISYELSQHDMMLEVLIFDRYGRKIRELSSFSPAGLRGEVIWDGYDRFGRPVRPGFYIILLTATDRTAGKSRRFKRTVAVAAGGS